MIGVRLVEFGQIAITKEPVHILYLLVNEFVTLLPLTKKTLLGAHS